MLRVSVPLACLVVLLAWWFARSSAGTGAAELAADPAAGPGADAPRGAQEDPALAGRPPTPGGGSDLALPSAQEAPTPTPTDSVRVRLTGVAWTPVRARTARLYLVPKDALGQDGRYGSYLYPVEGSAGCFDVPRDRLAGSQLCVEAIDTLGASLDGHVIAEADAEEIELPVEAAPVTTIRVVGMPAALRPKVSLVARSLATAGRPLHHRPGPRADLWLSGAAHGLDADGRLVEPFPTRAHVFVRTTLAGWVADPIELDVGNAGGEFTVRMRPSAVLVIAPRGLPGRGWFRSHVGRHALPHEVHVEYGERVRPRLADVGDRTVDQWETDLAPGRYTVRIEAEYHRPYEEVVEVRRYGEEVLVDPVMEPAHALGVLEIQAVLPTGTAVEDPKHTDFFEFRLRRVGTEEWVTPFDVSMAWRTQRLCAPAVPAGRYEVLLWERQHSLVAYVPEVVIGDGETTRLRLTLEAGRSFRLQPLADAGLKTGVRIFHGIRLRSPELGALPFYFQGFTGENLIDCCGGFEQVSVGPFPVQRVYAAWGEGEARREVELPGE